MIGGAVLWAVALGMAIPELWEHGGTAREVGWSAARPGQTPRVTRVTPGGPAEGILREGDRIIAIDGNSDFAGLYMPVAQVWPYAPGREYRARVERKGEQLDVTLRVGARPGSQWPLMASMLFGSLTFAAIGWLMGWQQPEFRTARLGWLATQITAFVYISLALEGTQMLGWYPSTLLSVLRLIGSWHLWVAYCFVAEFPYPPPASRVWRGIRNGLGVVCLGAWCVVASVNLSFVGGAAWLRRMPAWTLNAYSLATMACIVLTGVGVVAVLIRNYRVGVDARARSSIRLVAGAIAVAMGASGAASFFAMLTGQIPSPLVNLAPLPIPICFAYAVLRHGVLDLRLVVHRSLRYLLARQLLRGLTLLPLGLMVVRAIANPAAPIGSLFNIVGVGLVVAAVLGLEFRERLQQGLDRWYRRPAMEREKQLRALAAEIAGLGSWEEVEAMAPGRVMAILELEWAGFDEAGALELGPGEAISESERELLAVVAAQARLVREKSAAVQTERQRIAREIHDTAGHGFAGIALYMDAARKTVQAGATEEASQFLEEAGALARKSLRETRASIAGLREGDLAARLESLAGRNEIVTVLVGADAAGRASGEVQWHLARIAEEAVANACKHAGAGAIRVVLEAREGVLCLRICDDGRGFAPDAIGAGGYGLAGMRERTEQMGGTLTIASTAGAGTEIRVEVRA